MKNKTSMGESNFTEVDHQQTPVTLKIFRSAFIIASVSALLFSCSSGEYSDRANAENAKLADSVSGLISSSASKVGKADSDRTFIRTANIKFKVKDVRQATFNIEDIVSKHNGFVTYTNLSGNVSYQNQTKVTEDSLLQATHYNVDNSITLRVPNAHLDSVLREIAPLMEFLDHRTIKADDIKFTLLANQLAESRYAKHKGRYTKAIDVRGKKLKETANAENDMLLKQENADETRIETMQLLDQVNFSTVTLYIYQPETVKYAMIPAEKIAKPFTPSFAKRIGLAFMGGWNIFEHIILFFIEIWGVIVLMIAMYFLIRKLVIVLSKPELKKA